MLYDNDRAAISHGIRDYLERNGAVVADGHFVYTSGMHGETYVNMKAVAHDASWFTVVGVYLGEVLKVYRPEIVIGPETLGRSLAQAVGSFLGIPAIWCNVNGGSSSKQATFPLKIDFGRLVAGKRVVIVDDVLSTGSSIRLVGDLVASAGGQVVAAAVVVRRSPNCSAANCNVPQLEALMDLQGFEIFTEGQCAESGPCSRTVPVALHPGHGRLWAANHPDYPVAA